MADLIVILLVALAIGAAVWYIKKEKRKGVQCIGCPDSAICAKKACGGCSSAGGAGCSCQNEVK